MAAPRLLLSALCLTTSICTSMIGASAPLVSAISFDSWSEAPLPRPLSAFGVVAAQGRIYAIGGWNGAPSAQVAVYGVPRRNPFTS